MTKRKETTKCKETIDAEIALYFRNEFREARYATLKSPEDYQQILFALERFGAYVTRSYPSEKQGCQSKKRVLTLGDYKECVVNFIKGNHPLQGDIPEPCKDYHIEVNKLFEMVNSERNDALHKGAFVKILTSHLIELSIMLEDALMTIMADPIQNYMTRDPICAYPWQPISFIRQKMLENSFSYIPVYMKEFGTDEKTWYVISDYDIVDYLKPATGGENRKKRLSKTLQQAIISHPNLIRKAVVVRPEKKVEKALKCAQAKQSAIGQPILVQRADDHELLGIATPFDLM